MPYVACNIQSDDRLVGFRFLFIALLTVCFLPDSAELHAQEPQTPAPATTDPAAPAAVSQEPEAEPPLVSPPPVDETVAVISDCDKAIIAQERLTRTLREMRNPIARPAEAEATKARREYQGLLGRGSGGASDVKTIETHLSYLILELTDPAFLSNPINPARLIDVIGRDVQTAGRDIANPQKQIEFRRLYCGEVLKVCRKLMDNNLDARMAAIKIVSRLYEKKAVSGGAKAEMYIPAVAELGSILKSAEQPDSVKAVTADALREILQRCEVRVQDQFLICDALEAELKRKCTDPDYQLLLLDTALEITAPIQTIGSRDATAMRLFSAVIKDGERPVDVRCRAALGIGIGAWDPSATVPAMKLEDHVSAIAITARDTVIAYNSGDLNDLRWRQCGIDLFRSFFHLSPEQATGSPPLLPKGLLNRLSRSPKVNQLGPEIQAVAVKLIQSNQKFAPADVANLAAWINANP
jgi:hypothetical protein